MLTIEGVKDIFQNICSRHQGVASFKVNDIYDVDSTDNALPVIIFEVSDSRLIVAKNGVKQNQYTVNLHCYEQRLEDWSNLNYVFAHTHTLLNDVLSYFVEEPQYWDDKGIKLVGDISFQRTVKIGNDKLFGWTAQITFTAPNMICYSELPIDPISDSDSSYSGSGGGSGQYLTCATLSGCTTIQTIQSNIAELYTLTGGTGGATTYVQNSTTTYTGGTATNPFVEVNADLELRTLSAETIFSGQSDLSYLIGNAINTEVNTVVNNEINNYFANEEVVISAGTVTFCGATVFLGGIQLDLEEPKQPILWLTDSGQITGDTQHLGWDSNLYLMDVHNVSIGDVLYYSALPLHAIPFVNSAYALTGDSSFAFDGSKLVAPIVEATTVSATTFYSGNTNLNDLLGGGGPTHNKTYVQSGNYITTGGTEDSPVVDLATEVSVDVLSAQTALYYSGISSEQVLYGGLDSVLTGDSAFYYKKSSGVVTMPAARLTSLTPFTLPYVDASNNLLSGPYYNGVTMYSLFLSGLSVVASSIFQFKSAMLNGVLFCNNANGNISTDSDFQWDSSANRMNVNGEIITTYLRATLGLSATTIYSGTTNIQDIFATQAYVDSLAFSAGTTTFVQPGTNITTGGTASEPVVNLASEIDVTTLSADTIYSGTTNIQDLFAPKDLTINNDNTDRILAAGDAHSMLVMSGGSTQNIVVPRNSAVALPIGYQALVQQTGAGTVQFSADTSVTINSFSGYTSLAGQYAGASITKTDTNTWALIGNLA